MPRTHEEIMRAARASRGEGEGYTPEWSLQNVSRNFAAIGELLGGGRGRTGTTGAAGADGTSGPLGDRVPEAPDYAESPTGITGPKGGDTVVGAGQGLIETEEQRARGEYQAQREDEQTADVFAGRVRQDIQETTGRIDEASARVEEDRERFQEHLTTTQEQIQEIPTEITNEFNRLRDQFGDAADASFDRIDSQREEALTNAEQGRSAAMQAAVQGIQGTVNSQVAAIMANPELTDSQKQNMVAQVRLSGASSIAPAIGQTVLAFNQLSAQVATHFGSITGQLESTILTGETQLIGLQGQAFAQAQTAVGQMSTQLLEIDASASASFANSQSQLLATRSHATMTGNDILLRTLPEQSTPYLDLTGAATAAYEISSDIIKSQFAMDLQSYGMDLQIAMMRSMQGNPVSNLIQGALSGFASGGAVGAVMGAAGGFLGSQGPRI